MRWMWALVLVVGCGDDSAPPGGNPEAGGPDAPVADAPQRDSTMPDGDTVDASCDEITDAGLCCSRRRIYLNFDGVDVIADGSANDARRNRTFLLMSNKTVPPFLNGMANRDAVIAAVVAQLQQQLAGFDVELTRTRPGSGDYMMVIFGGDSANILGQAGFGAFGPLDCSNASRSDLMFVFDSTSSPIVANSAMFVLGIAIGLSTSTLAGDCLTASVVTSGPCTLSASAPVATTSRCMNAPATQDEPAAFAADLSCR